MKLYRAFVVRCWQEVVNDLPVWRFALTEIGQQEHARGFADWAHLAEYLSGEFTDDCHFQPPPQSSGDAWREIPLDNTEILAMTYIAPHSE